MNSKPSRLNSAPPEDDESVTSDSPRFHSSKSETAIPKLTELVQNSGDPDLIPMMHVDRVYPYPVARRMITIPPFLHTPQTVRRLPGVGVVDQHIERSVRKRKPDI